MEEKILARYVTPGDPIAFSGINAVAREFNISNSKARNILDKLKAYQTHREYHRPHHFNPYFAKCRRQFVQTDLIDVSRLKTTNRGIKYLMVLIDVFSRYLWVYPLKTKSGLDVRNALEEWLERDTDDVTPSVLTSDLGREYYNIPVTSLLAEWGVEKQKAVGTKKAAIAERVNKTLQNMIGKYLTSHKTNEYLSVLPDLVHTYNHRPHRTLNKMTPYQADRPENKEKVLNIHHERMRAIPKRKPIYKVNDIVRVNAEAKVLTPASRSYNPQFNPEFYYIDRINTKMPIPIYHLKAAEDHEVIEGGFYANELTLVGGDEFDVEKVIRTRRRRGIKESLVKWVGFNESFNSWINSNTLRKL